jgi:hypothetical protein
VERKSRPEKREEGEGKLGVGEEVEDKSGDRRQRTEKGVKRVDKSRPAHLKDGERRKRTRRT